MPITYDVKTDYLYNKGIEKGIEQGIEKGIEKGIERDKIDVVFNARLKGLSIDLIADIVKLPVDRVQQILKKMNIE